MARFTYRGLRGWPGLCLFIIVTGLAIAQQQGWLGGVLQPVADNQPGLYQVSQFVDGDTIAVNMNGKTERIRMVGVDTPETHKPNTPVQCYGPAAAAFTKNALANKKFRLVSDSLSTNRDRYDRLLRYVYLTDGSNFNQRLVREGYGFYYPYFPFTKSEQFAAEQAAAQKAKKGLWGNCSPVRNERGGYVSDNAS